MNERLECCINCGSPTGHAGAGDGSIYIGNVGPLCDECYETTKTAPAPRNGLCPGCLDLECLGSARPDLCDKYPITEIHLRLIAEAVGNQAIVYEGLLTTERELSNAKQVLIHQYLADLAKLQNKLTAERKRADEAQRNLDALREDK